MDPIDSAIQAVEAAPPVLVQVAVQIAGTEKHFVIQVPLGLTDAEVLEMAAWVIVQMRATAERIHRAPTLLVPGRPT